MRKLVLVIAFVLSFFSSQAQELKCSVSINSDRIVASNKQIIQTLERSLNDFVNNTKWTTKEVLAEEAIECSMFINISNVTGNVFTASIQVQSSRPIYESSYASPIFNFNDEEFTFEYIEFQNLAFAPNTTNSNLVSVIAFYVHMILGIDADSFELNSGTPYFEVAQVITDNAGTTGVKGWTQSNNNQSRFVLINEMMKAPNKAFRKTMYDYHLGGLDTMSQNADESKEKVIEAIKNLEEVYKVNSNGLLIRTFFDAKSDEIQKVLSGGAKVEINNIKRLLNKLSPINTVKWNKLK